MADLLLSEGIKLSYADINESSYTILTNLQEIPEIGNGAKERIEVTTLDESVKKYIAGLGDSGQDLAFKFLYDKTQFQTLAAMTETYNWKVTMPDGLVATFQGTPSVALDGVGTNAARTYTLTVLVESEIEFA